MVAFMLGIDRGSDAGSFSKTAIYRRRAIIWQTGVLGIDTGRHSRRSPVLSEWTSVRLPAGRSTLTLACYRRTPRRLGRRLSSNDRGESDRRTVRAVGRFERSTRSSWSSSPFMGFAGRRLHFFKKCYSLPSIMRSTRPSAREIFKNFQKLSNNYFRFHFFKIYQHFLKLPLAEFIRPIYFAGHDFANFSTRRTD